MALTSHNFSIDVRGMWSTRQAQRVVAALQEEADARGLRLRVIDVTTHGDPNRAVIGVFCRVHDFPVPVDTACEGCIEVAR